MLEGRMSERDGWPSDLSSVEGVAAFVHRLLAADHDLTRTLEAVRGACEARLLGAFADELVAAFLLAL